MAPRDDDNRGFFGRGDPGDRNRDGVNDEFDRRPGNQGVSAEYAEKYDKRSEQEFTNRLETGNQLEEARIMETLLGKRQEAQDAFAAAQSDVHFFPSVGKFIIPEQNTWAAHAELVKDESTGIYFNPDKYVYFDKIIADKLNLPALSNKNHPDYQKYAGLRTNLAVIRNDLIGMYLDDGAFDPGDEKYIPKITGVAVAIGDALSNDTALKRPFTDSFSMDMANVEGIGASEIYKFMEDKQEKPTLLSRLKGFLLSLTGIPRRDWELRPLSETPFSPESLRAPPPSHRLRFSEKELVNVCATPEMQQRLQHELGGDADQRVATACEGMLATASHLRDVSALDAPARETSVEEARTILRWLRNLQFADKDMETWLAAGTPPEQAAKAEALAQLVELFGSQLQQAAREYPLIVNDEAVDGASAAAGALAMAVALHSLDMLPPDHPRARAIEALLNTLPEQAELRQNQSLDQLLDLLEAGMERASGKMVGDRSATDRLLDMSNRIHAAAKKLRSVDTLEEPTREESIELAREILRKLKNLRFSSKPVEEAVDTGRPEDKAMLAQRIEEMVDIYKNLLFEAAQANPEIMNDPRIKEANEAVGGFAHGVKLMAAKEIPNSVAAAQQISADVTQMPDEWKDLQNRTVDRLVKSMEGGLEKAVGAIETQQQEQQQQDEEQQQAAEAALQQSDYSKRRRRRRRRSGSSATPAMTKSAKRRNASDLNGDGVLDKYQGLQLNARDLEAIRELGSSLNGLSRQASELPPITPVDPADKITPDDKTFAVRERENQRNPSNNNRRPRIQ